MTEILEAEQRHKNFNVHINYSTDQGRLTIESIVAATEGSIANKHIYMCGPSQMLAAFQYEFRRFGIPARSIHYEEFSFR